MKVPIRAALKQLAAVGAAAAMPAGAIRGLFENIQVAGARATLRDK